MSQVEKWACDVKISMPVAKRIPGPKVPTGGLAFTLCGMQHDLSEAEREEILSARFAPPS